MLASYNTAAGNGKASVSAVCFERPPTRSAQEGFVYERARTLVRRRVICDSQTADDNSDLALE